MPNNIYLKIYVTPSANVSNDRILRFYQAARSFWFREGIDIRVFFHRFSDGTSYWWQYTSFDVNAGTLVCGTPGNNENSLFNYNMDNRYISVFFVGGNAFAQSNGRTVGCDYASFRTANGRTTIADRIIISNGANPIILAHEIGHALFTRVEGGRLTQTNPGSENLIDPSHSTIRNNLMLSTVPNNPDRLTPEQRNKALQSRLVYFTETVNAASELVDPNDSENSETEFCLPAPDTIPPMPPPHSEEPIPPPEIGPCIPPIEDEEPIPPPEEEDL